MRAKAAAVLLAASVSCTNTVDGVDYDVAEANQSGRHLFDFELFEGNGRTCLTCHGVNTGTISPADVAARAPDDALFLHDGLDDGFSGTSRIRQHATIRVGLPLRGGVRLLDDPSATSVVVHRGIPSTRNSPALDPVIMLDGRAPSLQAQAADAIGGHAQAGVSPSQQQREKIAEFESTDERFFSSSAIEKFAQNGNAPKLPLGNTDSEKRGRQFFLDIPPGAGGHEGLCAHCHSGPMLNQTNQFAFGVPPGTRFLNILVADFNAIGNPVRRFEIGGTEVVSPDPGRALITGNPADANAFKIPSLWGVRSTAPYFHDNSAKSLQQLVGHYSTIFDLFGFGPLSAQEQADIVAYLKLL